MKLQCPSITHGLTPCLKIEICSELRVAFWDTRAPSLSQKTIAPVAKIIEQKRDLWQEKKGFDAKNFRVLPTFFFCAVTLIREASWTIGSAAAKY